MKYLALVFEMGIAIVGAMLALEVFLTGRVFVPGFFWTRGFVDGVGAYAMAVSWLCMAAAAIFTSCARFFPRQPKWREFRDWALIGFGVLFVLAVIGVIGSKVSGSN